MTSRDTKIKIIFLAVMPADETRAEAELQRAGLNFTPKRVANRKDFLAALHEFEPDIVISAYKQRGLAGLSAVRLVRERDPDLPFILLSETLSKRAVASAVRAGASDCILKDDLRHLPHAVRYALSRTSAARGQAMNRVSLRESETRYRRLFESSKDGILIVEFESGKIFDVNPYLIELLGYPREHFVGKKLWQIGMPEQIVQNTEAFRQLKASGYAHYSDLPLRKHDGRQIDVEFVSNVYLVGKRKIIQCNIRDITERREAETMIASLARDDILTGLANRATFVEELQLAIAGAKRGRRKFAVLYMDLDHFKDVNDTLGHPVGDQFLQTVARRLQAILRATDSLARFGGDEFALIANYVKVPEDVAVLAEKLIKTIGAPVEIDGNKVHCSASIGIAVYAPGGPGAETLLSQAEIALYRAKVEGRGTYRFFTKGMDAEVRARVTLGNELREAISGDQFFLVYHPQVDIETGRITGLEALVRWNHPTRGLVMPDEFIPAAEAAGLIVGLGNKVLYEACRQMKEWLDAGIAPSRIAVNVSALQVKAPLEVEKVIKAILAETGLPPERLELELTETALMESSVIQSKLLDRLRQDRLHIAIDDFGTGYSSLASLCNLPIDRIKIAQQFMFEMRAGSGNAAIVRTAIRLAGELGFDVLVEGVETAEQLALIRSWGCREVQGFYFSEPLSASDTEVALRAGKIVPSKIAVMAAC